MRVIIHRIYLATQALILIAGASAFIWVIYQTAYGLETGAYDNARNCAMRVIGKDLPFGVISSYSHKWTSVVRGNVILKENFKAMRMEAERITKKCSNYLAVDVSEESGEVSLFILSKGEYVPAHDLEAILYMLGLILGGTALLSIVLFVMKKWISIVFRGEKSV